MSGFGFGGFDLTSGFGALSDIGDKLQKLKDDVESSIDASLRADRFTTSGQEDQGTSQVDPCTFLYYLFTAFPSTGNNTAHLPLVQQQLIPTASSVA